MDGSGAWKAGGEMDGKDRKILLALTRNARMKMDEILISIPRFSGFMKSRESLSSSWKTAQSLGASWIKSPRR